MSDAREGSRGEDGPPAPPVGPSLAVLPLAALPDDGDGQGFADGVSEHLTYAFACTPGLFVSGRSSAFTFRARPVDAGAVGRALGVAHVLEGTLARADGRIVIEARLSAADGRGTPWRETFAGEEESLFDLQAALVEAAVRAVAPGLPVDPDEIRRRTRFPGDVGLYAKFLAAYSDHIPRTLEGARRLIASLDDLVRIMPDEPLTLALSAQCLVNLILQGWSADPDADRAKGLRHARAALRRPEANESAAVLMMSAYPLAYLGAEYESALALLGRSLAINPNSAAAHERSGWVRLYLGEAGRAIDHFRAAKRLSPLDTTLYRFHAGLGFGHTLAGAHETAVAWLRRAIDEMPSYTTSYRALASSLAHLGRGDEAEATARALLALEPGYRIGQSVRAYPDSPTMAHYIEGLRRAGLPE